MERSRPCSSAITASSLLMIANAKHHSQPYRTREAHGVPQVVAAHPQASIAEISMGLQVSSVVLMSGMRRLTHRQLARAWRAWICAGIRAGEFIHRDRLMKRIVFGFTTKDRDAVEQGQLGHLIDCIWLIVWLFAGWLID